MRRAERLFRLVQEMRSRGLCRADDLAGHFGVCVRTIYRDIAHLQGSGLPIEGEAGVGYLLRPGFDLPAMTFTHEQIDALATGLAFVETAGDEALAEAASDVRAKLISCLPETAAGRLARAPHFASRRDGRAAPVSAVVRQAIRDGHVLDIGYRNAQGVATHRQVEPLAIWAFTDGWLFVGWCRVRADFRAFRFDRITSAKDSGESFADHPDRNLAAFLATRFAEGSRPAD